MPSFIDYYHENEIYLLINQSIVPSAYGWVDCFLFVHHIFDLSHLFELALNCKIYKYNHL